MEQMSEAVFTAPLSCSVKGEADKSYAAAPQQPEANKPLLLL